MKQILIFNINVGKINILKKICEELSIRIVPISRKDYSQELEYLASIPGFKKNNINYKRSELPSEMLVFSGLTSDDIDEFLASYKKSMLPPINLKAVITTYNINWTPEALYSELLKEHMKM